MFLKVFFSGFLENTGHGGKLSFSKFFKGFLHLRRHFDGDIHERGCAYDLGLSILKSYLLVGGGCHEEAKRCPWISNGEQSVNDEEPKLACSSRVPSRPDKSGMDSSMCES